MQLNRTTTDHAERVAVPVAARWLGGAGALPFVALAGTALVVPPPAAAIATEALAGYGAVILSFLGGIQWGLAIHPSENASTAAVSSSRLTASVLPSLAGWVALLLPDAIGFALLAAGFALVLHTDLRAARRGQTPAWYPKLRWPLSVAVIATMLTGIAATIP